MIYYSLIPMLYNNTKLNFLISKCLYKEALDDSFNTDRQPYTYLVNVDVTLTKMYCNLFVLLPVNPGLWFFLSFVSFLNYCYDGDDDRQTDI